MFEQVGMSFNRIIYLVKVYHIVQAGVPSCSDDVTHRSCENFKCDVVDVNIEIPADFLNILRPANLYNSFMTPLN